MVTRLATQTIRFRGSRSDRSFAVANYGFLALALLVVMYPLVFVISCSFSSPHALMAGKVWLWPVESGVQGYRAVFQSARVWIGFKNSLIYASLGTLINVVLTVMLAYPLSRDDFVGRNFLMFFITFTMLFSGGIIPTFLLVKSLGLYNTRWAMMLPNAVAVWYVIVTRTYFQTNLPKELLEAAELDGCSNGRYILSVVVPLSGPIIAAITLFYAVEHWNSFFNALIYLQDRRLVPLQIVLRDILLQYQADATMTTSMEEMVQREMLSELLKYALIVAASVPMLMLYPFAQKYFVKGVMIGAIKG